MSPSLSKSVTTLFAVLFVSVVLVFFFKRIGEPPGLLPPGPLPGLPPPGFKVSTAGLFNSRGGGASSSPPVNSREGGGSSSVPPNGSGIDGGASSANAVKLLNAKVIISIEVVANSLKRNFVFMFCFCYFFNI